MVLVVLWSCYTGTSVVPWLRPGDKAVVRGLNFQQKDANYSRINQFIETNRCKFRKEGTSPSGEGVISWDRQWKDMSMHWNPLHAVLLLRGLVAQNQLLVSPRNGNGNQWALFIHRRNCFLFRNFMRLSIHGNTDVPMDILLRHSHLVKDWCVKQQNALPCSFTHNWSCKKDKMIHFLLLRKVCDLVHSPFVVS